MLANNELEIHFSDEFKIIYIQTHVSGIYPPSAEISLLLTTSESRALLQLVWLLF